MATVTTSSTARTRAKKRGSAVYVGPTPQDWYKDAVIYEVHVRAFQDSNGDGIGDFRGLTSRLDYLQDLGVTAVWVLPFYPSPLRDDGYDIADYTSVNPSYGSMADVRRFVTEAHKRDIKVITELVINHTSDQHPWFQRARRAPAGSSHRDFYVWSDTPDKYPGVRIIFQDTETSNWTYDQVAGQYYWHRFFGHQPDLNFDNPAVLKAVKKVMDFWFEIGVDGMRLDAVPYLIERDGTNCENLPETHEILKDLRRHLDDRWPGRMFLAEANQWPEDAIAYYGVREAEGALGSSDDAVRVGDECHMNFHFPLMPRLFMSLRMEDRFPIVDILQQTPAIPDNCQWAMFLRNHDELTLEMVTDEERDYMYKAYARDRQMRINVGIRRRLSPLLEHDRRKIELMNGLLMSMPGTPVLYYGDEIGMGDNVYLGDRDAVRTPMQWSSDRNAGFSKSNPQQLYLPVIIEPGSHFENVNVESQQENASSLLWWMKRLIAIRKSRPVLARGEMEFLQPENSKVVAFLRTGMEANDGQGEHDMLVVANLSRFSQPVELDLAQYEGRTPVEVFGLTRFPQIGELPYLLTMGPHSFYWFSLERPEGEAGEEDEAPTVEIGTDASSWLRGAGLTRWASRALPGILPKQRWFSSKARTIREVAVADTVPLGRDGRSDEAGLIDSALCAVRVSFTEGDDETYLIPLVLIDAERALRQTGVQPANTMAVLKHRESGVRTVLADGSGDESFWRELHGLIARRRAVRGRGGDLVGLRVPGSGTAPSGEADEVRVSRADQSNSSAVFGRSSIFKLFRRVEEGVNPDFEIGQHLTRLRRFEHTPRMLGAVEYRPKKGAAYTVATKQELVQNEGDAWAQAIDAVDRFFEAALVDPDAEQAAGEAATPMELAERDPTDIERKLTDGYLDSAELLGERTAGMHAALADGSTPDFDPEPFSKLYLRSLYQTLRNGVRRPLQTLRSRAGKLDGEARELAEQVLDRKDELLAHISRVRDLPLVGKRVRCHGDYHLGQVLWSGMDYAIIDFEGEPMRPLSERRLKRSCLSDVAGMCRSLDYAASSGLNRLSERGLAPHGEDDSVTPATQALADLWSRATQGAFLRGYLRHIDRSLIPTPGDGLEDLLDAWTIHKAAYEIDYELNNRPAWAAIPLRGVVSILDAAKSTA